MCVQEKVVDVKVARSSSAKPTNTARATPIYLSLPGDYSGDVWHAAAAMIVNCNVHVIITRQSNKLDSKDVRISARAIAFFEACGIPEARVHVVDVGVLVLGTMGESKDSRERDIASATAHVTAASGTLTRLKLPSGPVHAVYSSTYIWVSAVLNAKEGPAAVLKTIRHAFVASFEDRQPEAAARIREVVARLSAPTEAVEEGKREEKKGTEVDIEPKKPAPKPAPFLLLNMRMANYHPEDNTSHWIYEEVATLCRTNRVRLVCVGAWNKGDKTHISDEGIWMKHLPYDVVDVYGFCQLKSGLADLQSVAYFWAICASQPNCVGVLGGRSGSSDVAGFSGFAPDRLLCWTARRTDDPGYQRQHLMAACFMSLLDLSADNHGYKKCSHYVLGPKSPDAMYVDLGTTKLTALQHAVTLTFKTKERSVVAPSGYAALQVSDDELDPLVKSPGVLTFCGFGDVALALASLPGGIVYRARTELAKRFTIGTARGDGNNCLIHSMYQLLNGRDTGTDEQIAEIRKTLNSAVQPIVNDSMLDIYNPHEGGPLMASFAGIRIQVVQIDESGTIHEGPVLGDAGPIRYLLHQGNHYEPLWPV